MFDVCNRPMDIESTLSRPPEGWHAWPVEKVESFNKAWDDWKRADDANSKVALEKLLAYF